MYIVPVLVFMRLTILKTSLCGFLFFLKNLASNEAETSKGKLYYIHLHSQWVGIQVMAKKKDLHKVWKPFKCLVDALGNWIQVIALISFVISVKWTGFNHDGVEAVKAKVKHQGITCWPFIYIYIKEGKNNSCQCGCNKWCQLVVSLTASNICHLW